MSTFISLLIIVLWLVLSVLVSETWRRKGLSTGRGFVISLFFSPLVGILMGIFEVIPTRNVKQDKLATDVLPPKTEKVKICANCHQGQLRSSKVTGESEIWCWRHGKIVKVNDTCPDFG